MSFNVQSSVSCTSANTGQSPPSAGSRPTPSSAGSQLAQNAAHASQDSAWAASHRAQFEETVSLSKTNPYLDLKSDTSVTREWVTSREQTAIRVDALLRDTVQLVKDFRKTRGPSSLPAMTDAEVLWHLTKDIDDDHGFVHAVTSGPTPRGEKSTPVFADLFARTWADNVLYPKSEIPLSTALYREWEIPKLLPRWRAAVDQARAKLSGGHA